jgi:hypothetical protein
MLVPSRQYLHALGKQGTGRQWPWRKRTSAAESLQAAAVLDLAARAGPDDEATVGGAEQGKASGTSRGPQRNGGGVGWGTCRRNSVGRSWRWAGGCAASGEDRTAAKRVTWPISPCAASHVDLPFAASSSSALDPARSPAYTMAAESALEASARRIGLAACRCCKGSRRGRQHGLKASSKSQIRSCFFNEKVMRMHLLFLLPFEMNLICPDAAKWFRLL